MYGDFMRGADMERERDMLQRLVLDVVDSLPNDAEEVWRFLGYDPDGWPCFDSPMEPERARVEELLGRIRTVYTRAKLKAMHPERSRRGETVGGSVDVRKLAPPPGPLCWGCDEPFDMGLVFPWAEVDGKRVHHESDCKREAAARIHGRGS